MKLRRSLVFAVAVVTALALGAHSAWALVPPEKVLGGKDVQIRPFREGDWLAYSSISRAGSLLARARNLDDQTDRRLNASNTRGLVGGFDPGTSKVILQQFTNRRSDLYFRDIGTNDLVKVPKVNSKAWEWYPLISTDLVSFFRDRVVKGAIRTSMHIHLRNSDTIRKIWDIRLGNRTFVANGSIGLRYASWTVCGRSCNVFVYDWQTKDRWKVPLPDGKHQYAPVVDEGNEMVYFARSGNRCGRGVGIYRVPLGDLSGTPEKIVALPRGIDLDVTSSLYANGETGMLDLYFGWWECARDTGDIYVAPGVDFLPT